MNVLIIAVAGGLIWYGIAHRHTQTKQDAVYDKIENNPEGWFAIAIGALLLLGTILSI